MAERILALTPVCAAHATLLYRIRREREEAARLAFERDMAPVLQAAGCTSKDWHLELRPDGAALRWEDGE